MAGQPVHRQVELAEPEGLVATAHQDDDRTGATIRKQDRGERLAVALVPMKR
jgi:hypothetical protein